MVTAHVARCFPLISTLPLSLLFACFITPAPVCIDQGIFFLSSFRKWTVLQAWRDRGSSYTACLFYDHPVLVEPQFPATFGTKRFPNYRLLYTIGSQNGGSTCFYLALTRMVMWGGVLGVWRRIVSSSGRDGLSSLLWGGGFR